MYLIATLVTTAACKWISEWWIGTIMFFLTLTVITELLYHLNMTMISTYLKQVVYNLKDNQYFSITNRSNDCVYSEGRLVLLLQTQRSPNRCLQQLYGAIYCN